MTIKETYYICSIIFLLGFQIFLIFDKPFIAIGDLSLSLMFFIWFYLESQREINIKRLEFEKGYIDWSIRSQNRNKTTSRRMKR